MELQAMDKSSVNLQQGVWVAVRPSPGWRTRALRANASPRGQLSTAISQTSTSYPKLMGSGALAEESRSVIWQWEYGWMHPWRRMAVEFWTAARKPMRIALMLLVAFLVGWKAASGPDAMIEIMQLRDRL